MSAQVDAATIASAILDRGGTIKELRQHIPDKEDALRFFANYQADKYRLPPPSACCNCGAPSSIMTHFSWRATYATQFAPNAADVLLLFAGFVRISTSSKFMEFQTHHGFCGACWKKHWMKRGLANLLEFIGLLGGVICLLIAPLGFAVYICFRNDRQAASMLWGGILGVAGLIAAFFIIRFASMLRVPRSLRQIPRFPFRYFKVKKGNPMSGFPVELQQ